MAGLVGAAVAVLLLAGLRARIRPGAALPPGNPAGDHAMLQIHEAGGLGGASRMRVTLWASGRAAFAPPDLVLREAHLDPAAVARLGRAAEVLFDLPDRLFGLCGDDVGATFFAVDGGRGHRSVEVCGMGLEQARPREHDREALDRLRALWRLVVAELPPALGDAPSFRPDEAVVETTPVDPDAEDVRARPEAQEAVRALVARVTREWPAPLTGHLTGAPARQAAALAHGAREVDAADPDAGPSGLFRIGAQVYRVGVRPVLPVLSLPSATWPEGGLPRHPRAVAYSAPGTPYRFAGVPQASVARWYRSAMAAKGWRLVKARGDELQVWLRAERPYFAIDPLIFYVFQPTSFYVWPLHVQGDVPPLPSRTIDGCLAPECQAMVDATVEEAAAWYREYLGYFGWREVGPDTYQKLRWWPPLRPGTPPPKGETRLRLRFAVQDGRPTGTPALEDLPPPGPVTSNRATRVPPGRPTPAPPTPTASA